MLERFRGRQAAPNGTPREGATAYDDASAVRADPSDPTTVRDRDRLAEEPRGRGTGGRSPGELVAARRDHQRAEFGGLNWGAAFFGWLVAIGVAVLLVAILGAAGTAIGLTEVDSTQDVTSAADTIGIVGGLLLLAVLFVAYFAGGYVAGRMSRFDGGRQGFGVWVIGLLVTVAVAVAGAVLGSEYNIFEKLDLPRIPVDEGSLTTGGVIALAAIVVGTVLAAILGGKTGERYHRRVDRHGLEG